MATITPTVTDISGDGSVKKFSYAALTTTNTSGEWIAWAQWADRSVQVTGTFGAGGNLNIEGSNDGGTTAAILTDPQGNALSFTATKIEQITEVCELVRPKVSAGDGTTSLAAVFVCRRANPMRT